MIASLTQTNATGRYYHKERAMNLLRSVGRENAIDACFRHNWMGTLEFILKDEQLAR